MVAELLEQHPDVISVLILGTLSPKKQASHRAMNIVCKNDYQLIFKNYDDVPACVTSFTAKRLVEIGWGKIQHRKSYER